MERLTPKEMADEMSNFLNTLSSDERTKEFVAEMKKDHRTLQQSFTRLCMAWIADLAERQHYDDRNEASVKLAKEIKRAILNEEGQFPPFLPFI